MSEQELINKDILGYLEQHQKKELLRFVSVGSVDDGKSTLIGRLIYDTHGISEDQLSAMKRATKTGREVDLSLLTDGLKAEREQGITIDVAYRYFSTAKRYFSMAGLCRHALLTRNMTIGVSTAKVAIILIDARHGKLQQLPPYAFIVSLMVILYLGIFIMKLVLLSSTRP